MLAQQQNTSDNASENTPQNTQRSVAIADGGGLIKKIIGKLIDGNSLLNDQDWIDYWASHQTADLQRQALDINGAKGGDQYRVPLDAAQIELDKAELGYYTVSQAITAHSIIGGEVMPGGEGAILTSLKVRIQQASDQYYQQRAIYMNQSQ